MAANSASTLRTASALDNAQGVIGLGLPFTDLLRGLASHHANLLAENGRLRSQVSGFNEQFGNLMPHDAAAKANAMSPPPSTFAKASSSPCLVAVEPKMSDAGSPGVISAASVSEKSVVLGTLSQQEIDDVQAVSSQRSAAAKLSEDDVQGISSMAVQLTYSHSGLEGGLELEDAEEDRKRQSQLRKDAIEEKAEMKKAKRQLEAEKKAASMFAFVHTEGFGMLSASFILANSIYIGVQTDLQVKFVLDKAAGRRQDDGLNWMIGDMFFAIVFLIEVLLRMCAQRRSFIFGLERGWNAFDVTVVTTSIVELVTDLLGFQLNMGISVLRTLRVVRILRVLRSANSFSVLRNLKTMLFALADPGCSSSFASAIILLASCMYIFALLFMQGIRGFVEANSQSDLVGAMEMYYGSLDRTLWTLIGSVTGGYDWAVTADPVTRIGPVYVFSFLLYISFVLLGLLNILNGIFVNAALQASMMNRELAIDSVITKREGMIEDMVALFLEADSDRSGTVSWDEFQGYLQDEKIKAYFMALELDTNSVAKIFDLLDTEGQGELALVQFVEGCIQLRGNAKMVDMSIMQKDYHMMLAKLEDRFHHLHRSVQDAGASTKNIERLLVDSRLQGDNAMTA